MGGGEFNGAARQVERGVECSCFGVEFATTKKSHESDTAGCVDVESGGGKMSKESLEDGQCDGLFRLAIWLSMVALDAADEVLDHWGFASLEGEICVDVE